MTIARLLQYLEVIYIKTYIDDDDDDDTWSVC